MFATIRQARVALSHLNPAEVRKDAARAVRVGLIAATEYRYAAMEEALVPAASGHEERILGMSAIFRGGDPDAPANVDLVLYDEGIPAPKGAYMLYAQDLPGTLEAVLHDDAALALPLARQFPGLR